jgi:hypothetical protein
MSYIRLLYHAVWNRPAFQAVAILWHNFLRSLTLGYENKTPSVSIGQNADNKKIKPMKIKSIITICLESPF